MEGVLAIRFGQGVKKVCTIRTHKCGTPWPCSYLYMHVEIEFHLFMFPFIMSMYVYTHTYTWTSPCVVISNSYLFVLCNVDTQKAISGFTPFLPPPFYVACWCD
jgi:hypothetical protein